MVLYYDFIECVMDKKPIVVDTPGKLLEINSKPQFGCHSGESFFFNKGEIRSKIEKILDVTEDYSFLKLAVNTDAIPPVQEFLQELNKKRGCECNDRYWLNSGTDVYYGQLHRLLNDDKVPFASWPIVEKVGNPGTHQDTAFWPVVYLLRHCDESKFHVSLSNLHSEKVWNRLVEREAPQNYTLPVLELWRERQVIPLSVDEKIVRIYGETLKNMVDLLVPFENKRDYHDYSVLDD